MRRRYWGLGDTRFAVIAVSPGGAHLEQDDKFRTDLLVVFEGCDIR